MNIWALDKDTNIKSLLLKLEYHFQHSRYKIICRGEEDFRSVRLANHDEPNVELYIYCYGQQQDHYGIHIEYPHSNSPHYSDLVEIHENISFEQLVTIISTNLGIAPQPLS